MTGRSRASSDRSDRSDGSDGSDGLFGGCLNGYQRISRGHADESVKGLNVAGPAGTPKGLVSLQKFLDLPSQKSIPRAGPIEIESPFLDRQPSGSTKDGRFPLRG